MNKLPETINSLSRKIRSMGGLLFAVGVPWGHVAGYIGSLLGVIAIPLPGGKLEKSRQSRFLTRALLLFFFWGIVLSVTISRRPYSALETVFTYFAHWMLPFLLGYGLSPKLRIKSVYLWIFSLLALGLVSLTAYFGWVDIPRLSSEGLLKGLHTHIQFGTLLLIAAQIMLALFLMRGTKGWKALLYGLSGALCVFLIFLTGSRGVWFAGAISIGGALTYSVIAGRKRRFAIAFLAF